MYGHDEPQPGIPGIDILPLPYGYIPDMPDIGSGQPGVPGIGVPPGYIGQPGIPGIDVPGGYIGIDIGGGIGIGDGIGIGIGIGEGIGDDGGGNMLEDKIVDNGPGDADDDDDDDDVAAFELAKAATGKKKF